MVETPFMAGAVLQHSAVAIVILSLLSMPLRRRRGSLMVAVDTFAWVVIASGALVGVATIWEAVQLLLGGNLFEKAAFANRAAGNGAGYYWISAFSVVLAPQLFWWRRCRTAAWLALVIGLVISAPFIIAMLPPWIG
jgi:molybdopterin-containing oxidoreductase family membrane subunit